MKGSLINRGKDVWLLKFDIGKDDSGKRQQRYETFHGKKSQANDRMLKILNEVIDNEYLDASDLTVGGWVDYWLTKHMGSKATEKTKERYTQLLKLHIQGCAIDQDINNYPISRKKLQDLNEDHIEDHYNFLRIAGLKSRSRQPNMPSKGMSETTLAHVHRAFSKALAKAAKGKNRIIPRNPMIDLDEKPRQRPSLDSANKNKVTVLDADQIDKIIAVARGYDWEMFVFICLAYVTGCRRGEEVPLNWLDIDFDKKTLRITKAVNHTKKFGLQVGEPKNANSKRTLSLPDDTLKMLRAHKVKQIEASLRIGKALPGNALVFPKNLSTPLALITPLNISRRFGTIARKAGFPGLKLHSLRHSNASILLSGKTDAKTVSQMLGHANPTVTLNIYSHVLQRGQDHAAGVVSTTMDSSVGKHL